MQNYGLNKKKKKKKKRLLGIKALNNRLKSLQEKTLHARDRDPVYFRNHFHPNPPSLIEAREREQWGHQSQKRKHIFNCNRKPKPEVFMNEPRDRLPLPNKSSGAPAVHAGWMCLNQAKRPPRLPDTRRITLLSHRLSDSKPHRAAVRRKPTEAHLTEPVTDTKPWTTMVHWVSCAQWLSFNTTHRSEAPVYFNFS